MSVSGLDSTVSTSAVQNPFQQRRTDFRALASALRSGDLAGAQQAFAAWQQDAQGGPQGQGAQPGGSISNDMQSLQKALQSGDLAGAQKAFATLQQDMRSVHHGHGHHHHKHGGGIPAVTSPQSTSATTATDADGGVTGLGGVLNVQA
jgi:hypothetical protein